MLEKKETILYMTDMMYYVKKHLIIKKNVSFDVTYSYTVCARLIISIQQF